MSKQTNSTIKTHAASWSITGKGASKRYRMAIPTTSKASKGDRFKATSKAGVETIGTLVELTSVADGVELWEFTKFTKSPEQMAHDRALRADAQRAYWDSDAGRQTAERIKARAERKAQATTEQTNEQTTSEASAPVDPMAEMIGRLVRSGLTPEQAASAALAVLGSSAPVASAPVASAPVARKSRTTKSTTTSTNVTTDETARKRVCPSCGTVAVLKHHRGAGMAVCTKCHPSDADTIKLRAARLAK